jgi:ParB-like chromosome segregation protein Spo0J
MRKKVRLVDLKPNPYRDIGVYPFKREKIDVLKLSIDDTGFWDNILARDHNGQIQIAYGHHRLKALQEL